MRISTTVLESFRLYLGPDNDWMTEQSLIDSILGKFVPTPQVELGLAFGQILEAPDRFAVAGGYQHKGYTFDDATMAPCLALMDHARGLFEVKAQKRYGDVDVVAVADQIVGAHLFEHKTTTSSFNIEKYLDSYQWRFMVDIFEPAQVTYHVFLLDDHGNGVVEVKGIESFNVFPYAALHQDCCALLDQFVAYVKQRGLDGELRRRQQHASRAA